MERIESMAKKSSFRGKVGANAQKQKTSGAAYGYLNLPKGVNVFTPEPGGRHSFDIMPYVVTNSRHPDRDEDLEIAVKGSLWWKLPFKTHRNIGATNETVVCPSSVGKRCPICEYRALQIKEGAEKETTDALKTSQRNLYIIIPKKDKKYEEKPHIWDVSQFLFQNLLTDELEENEEYEVFPDLEEGLTLRVRFDSKTIGSSKPFAEASRIDFEERKKGYNDAILDEIPSLDEVLNILSAKELEAKLFEIDPVEDEPEPEEEERPARKARKPEPEEEEEERPKKRKKVEPEEEEEEPEPPKRRARKPEPEPEEEEEPEPPKKSKKLEPAKRRSIIACIACEGTGKNSKGGPCRACGGTGERQNKNKCPHGFKFGIDTEEHDECFECDEWDACMTAKEDAE